MGLLEGFTGYLLPWDQTAYWATVVGININGTAPFLGPFIRSFLQGGGQIGPDTLSRFYSIHMLADPGRDLRPDRAAPLPRRPPGRDVAAVVEGGGGRGAGRADLAERRSAPASSGRGRGEGSSSECGRRAARAVPALQEGRQGAREAVLPVRDVPRHGHEPRGRVRDRRPRVHLEVDGERRRPGGLARQALRRAGRPGDDQLRPAARLVLLLPLLPAADLQVAGVGDPRHGRDPDDPAGDPARAAVPRPAARALAAPPARRRRSPRSSS